MTQPPVQLDYAHSSSRRPSPVWRRVGVMACCFGASWLTWLVIGFAAYDPIEQDLDSLLTAAVAVPGTLCGLILSMVILLVIPEQRRHTRGS